MDYTPRPTTYNGTTMRSRLEAGFAQLLDHHGLPWKYESRAFGSQAGQYLPDFEAVDGERPWFFEVKPEGQGTPRVLERMKIILGTFPDARLEVFEGRWDNGNYTYQLTQQWPPAKPPRHYFVYVVPGCDSWHLLPTVDDQDILASDYALYIASEMGVDLSHDEISVAKVYTLPDAQTSKGVVVHAVSFHKGEACLVSPIPLPWLTDYLVGQTTR